MQPPTDAAQLLFLEKVQRLLDQGAFSSTYKFALLLSLADLAVELGGDEGRPLALSDEDLAERFLANYWEQARPYVTSGRDDEAGVGEGRLWQNSDKRSSVVSVVAECREVYGGSLARFRGDRAEWSRRRREVARTIRVMPLWKLQRVAGGVDPFLYEQHETRAPIELRGTAVFCLRRFYVLLREMVITAWIRQLRAFRRNRPLLDAADDLREFLFGEERRDLSAIRPALVEMQAGRCFYCEKAFTASRTAAVDHFVPWVRYPLDLAQNYVAAHGSCNGAKSDAMAAVPHLERWCGRNADLDTTLVQAAGEAGIAQDLPRALHVARWAYERVEAMDGRTWLAGRRRDEPLAPRWRELLRAV